MTFANKMPPFLLGNWRWDNWVLHDLIKSNEASVVDVTNEFSVVHIGVTTAALGDRPGAIHNSGAYDVSMVGLQGMGLGRITYAHYKFEHGKVVPNIDLKISRARLIFKHINLESQLVVVTVPCGFVGMLKNWVGWARRTNLNHFFVFAMDQDTVDYAN
jgi:hypothetical protein